MAKNSVSNFSRRPQRPKHHPDWRYGAREDFGDGVEYLEYIDFGVSGSVVGMVVVVGTTVKKMI